jgi:hypothetical protein
VWVPTPGSGVVVVCLELGWTALYTHEEEGKIRHIVISDTSLLIAQKQENRNSNAME